MPLRPIDMQVALPRVSEVRESKSTFLHRDDISHNNANKSMQEETIKKQKAVNKMDSSAKTKVNERKKQSKKNKKKKESDADTKNQSNLLEEEEYHIDIKI